MTDPQDTDPAAEQNPLMEDASLWFARMRGPEAEIYRAEFEAWLTRGAAHMGAFNKVVEVWNIGKFMAEPEEAVDLARLIRPRGRWPLFAAVGVSILAVAAAVGVMTRSPVVLLGGGSPDTAVISPVQPHDPLDLASAADRSQRYTLSDGSVVELARASRVTIAFSATQRALRLTQGSGRFTVAHGAKPFIVYAGQGSVTAHGTVFDVAIDRREKVTVRLLRGAVDVALPASSPSPAKPLLPGEQVQFARADDGSIFVTGIPDTVLTPTDTAKLPQEFDNVRLADVVAGTHPANAIALANPSIGNVRVSGRFGLGDPETLSRRLADLFDLSVTHETQGRIVLDRRREKVL